MSTSLRVSKPKTLNTSLLTCITLISYHSAMSMCFCGIVNLVLSLGRHCIWSWRKDGDARWKMLEVWQFHIMFLHFIVDMYMQSHGTTCMDYISFYGHITTYLNWSPFDQQPWPSNFPPSISSHTSLKWPQFSTPTTFQLQQSLHTCQKWRGRSFHMPAWLALASFTTGNAYATSQMITLYTCTTFFGERMLPATFPLYKQAQHPGDTWR